MAQLLHLGLHGPFSVLFGIYSAIFWHLLLLALLVVLENPPAHSSLYGPRSAVQDDTSRRLGWWLSWTQNDVCQLNWGQQCRFRLLYVLGSFGGKPWSPGKSPPEWCFLGPWKVFSKKTDGLCNQNLVDALFHGTLGKLITYLRRKLTWARLVHMVEITSQVRKLRKIRVSRVPCWKDPHSHRG